MNEDEIIYLLKILEVAIIASIKFAIAPFEAERYGFSFRDSFLITAGGGIAGVLAFTFIGEGLSFGWKKLKGMFKNRKVSEGGSLKKFTSGNRFIVRVKMRFGLLGLVLTTPSLISIPFGTIVINHFYRKKIRNLLFLIISLLGWSLILNGIAQYLKLSQYLPASL